MIGLKGPLKTISLILNPICIPLYALCAIVNQPIIPHKEPLQWGTSIGLWSILFAVLPLLLILIMKKQKYITSWYAKHRQERFRLYPFTILLYLIGYAILHLQNPTPLILIRFSIIPISVTIALFICNFFWKASAHTAAIVACTACIAILNYTYPAEYLKTAILMLCPIVVMVMFARWRLGAHSLLEIGLGTIIGILAASCAMHYFLKL